MPNDAAAVVSVSPVGSYTVTVPGGGVFEAGSVAVAAGVTLDIAGALSIAGSGALSTTVIEAGGQLSGQSAIKLGTTLSNAGLISATVPNTFFQL